MKENHLNVYLIFLRYLIILIAGLGNLYFFYWLFTGPTIAATLSILKLVSPETLALGNLIVFNSSLVEIVPACIAGAAYYLLFILGMSIPLKKISRRFYLIAFCFATFFLINVLRIVVFTLLVDKSYFQTLHMLSWYILSTLFVVIIWFSGTYLFKIKEVPIYTDFKYLISNTKKTKGKNKHNNSGKKNSKR